MMDLNAKNILLTGAGGGIGRELATRLAASGARLMLTTRAGARSEGSETFTQLCARADIVCESVDLCDVKSRELLVRSALEKLGSIDLLINCAGATSFRPFATEDPEILTRIIELNLVAPMHLSRLVLPNMLGQKNGRIVNIGSTFGSIGFPWFAAYSASKFGLRGLSEALRRELAGTGIGITYVAPRAVKTKLNTSAVMDMAQATGMTMDSADRVAIQVIRAIERDKDELFLGFPERFFARLNGLLPRMVDTGLSKKTALMAEYCRD